MPSTQSQRRPKQAKAVESLSQLANQLGPGAKLPTVQELSQSLGITKVTLSLCLQQLEDSGVITRRAGSGIYVSPRIFQKNIGLVFGKNIFAPGVSPIYSQLIEHCSERALLGREHFSFYLDINPAQAGGTPAEGHGMQRDLTEALTAGKLHGLILACPYNGEEETWLRGYGVPLVTTSERSHFPGRITPDYQMLVRMGIQSLVARGCRRLGIVAQVEEHMQTFERTMTDMGLPLEKSWMVGRRGLEDPVENHVGLGHEAVQQLLRVGERAAIKGAMQGLIVTDDIVAVGVCGALQQAGIEVGKDIHIASHANQGSLALSEWEDVIIRLEVNPQAMVETLFLMLETLMAGLPLPQDAIFAQPRVRIGSQC